MKVHNIKLTRKQHFFVSQDDGEILFGGSAGGGKSYAQVVDSLLYAIKYPTSRQLLLRRTLVELEKSLLRIARNVYPVGTYSYKEAKHLFEFHNGSIIDFGYIGNENDTTKYQSVEYDVIRFDELTHFTEHMYLYMLSRLRGANNFPKSIKCTTNPGGVGHDFVKKRFIDMGEWGKEFQGEFGKRIFIPSSVFDNKFLLEADSGYVERLKNLPKGEREALLYGNWDIFEGRFFPEFSRTHHVVQPFVIPPEMKKFCVFDYGLDMLACYFVAVDIFSNCYCYREIYQSDLIISECVEKIKASCKGENIQAFIAPGDMWNRNRESGQTVAGIFKKYGINLVKAVNKRDIGWYELKEMLKMKKDEFGVTTSRLKVFSSCTNLIRCLGSIQVDKNKVFDCSNSPHELTHSVDALRYFASFSKKDIAQVYKPSKQKSVGERGIVIPRI